jgi:hypothetical protein
MLTQRSRGSSSTPDRACSAVISQAGQVVRGLLRASPTFAPLLEV